MIVKSEQNFRGKITVYGVTQDCRLVGRLY